MKTLKEVVNKLHSLGCVKQANYLEQTFVEKDFQEGCEHYSAGRKAGPLDFFHWQLHADICNWETLNDVLCSEEKEKFQKWQPISTAPKDGTWILCYENIPNDKTFSSVFAARWRVDIWIGQYSDYEAYNPTHWMLLPEPPVE